MRSVPNAPRAQTSVITIEAATHAPLSGHIIAQVVCIGIACGIWAVYQPGILDGDGISQYTQATFRSYTDWSPPVMSLCLRAALKAGQGLGLVTFGQAILAVLALYHFAHAWARFVSAGRLSACAASWPALGTVILLLLPITPLVYYLVHFSKDTWTAICLLAMCAAALNLHLNGRAMGWCPFLFWSGTLATAAGLLPLVRYNAVLQLPVIGVLAFVAFRRNRWTRAFAVTASFLAIQPAASAVIYGRYHCARIHPEDQLMADELVGLCVLNDAYRAELPFTNASLIGDKYRTGYLWGAVDPLFLWYPDMIVKPEYAWNHHAELSSEYWRTVRRHPIDIARVKWNNFAASMLDRRPYWHHHSIDENTFGIKPNDRFQRLRAWWSRADAYVASSAIWHWLSGWHLPWLCGSLAAFAIAVGAYWRKRGDAALLRVVILALPASYYALFLISTVSHNYRYMFPATLLVQGMALGAALARLAAIGGAEVAASTAPDRLCAA